MKRNSLKFCIDTALFITIGSIAAIGMLLGFVIPKGKAASASKVFLGLHRHQWGDIHLYLSILLLVLLAVHLWLNWTWIVQSAKRHFGDHWKTVLRVISIAWLVILFIAWIVAKS